MARGTPAIVKGEMLRWARETAGMTASAAAERMKVDVSRILEWESGDETLTLSNLHKLAEVYRRPFAAFFLPHPPAEEALARDFRRHSLDGGDREMSPALRAELRRAQARRQDAIDLAEMLGEEVPVFRLRATRHEDPEEVGGYLRAALLRVGPVDMTEPSKALRSWIAHVEALGVLVFHIPHTSQIGVDEVRAFSLWGRPFPAVVLNGGDSARGRIFSLMHEMAHLMLRRTGVCDETVGGSRASKWIEAFCNATAAAALLPMEDLRRMVPLPVSSEGQVESVELDLSKRYQVSEEVVARRLRTAGLIEPEMYKKRRAFFRRRYEKLEEETKKGARPPYFRMVLRANGPTFSRLVVEALDTDKITLRDVSDYLSLKLDHWSKVRDGVFAQEAD